MVRVTVHHRGYHLVRDTTSRLLRVNSGLMFRAIGNGRDHPWWASPCPRQWLRVTFSVGDQYRAALISVVRLLSKYATTEQQGAGLV